MLIDVHAHFWHDRTPRADWKDLNRNRLEWGDRIGITWHVASVLGSWGRHSPTYFPSPADLDYGNEAMHGMQVEHPGRIRSYVCVNPNFPDHAEDQIRRRHSAGAVGIKLAASRRVTDPLVDGIAELAGELGLPVLQHIWQHRRRDWPGQEASDGAELATLAARHPRVNFILAHLGGGGDWLHTLPAVRQLKNIFVDLSGSGVDGGLLESAVNAVGTGRLHWGCDLTLCTGFAKLR
ncbi:MAG: amidohydrolase family protein, partial [Gemmatimonadales bacterium]